MAAVSFHWKHNVGTERWHVNAFTSRRPGILLLIILSLAALTSPSMAAAAGEPSYEAQRGQMIRTIEAHIRETSFAIGRDHIDPRALRAMGCNTTRGIRAGGLTTSQLRGSRAADRIRTDYLATAYRRVDD